MSDSVSKHNVTTELHCVKKKLVKLPPVFVRFLCSCAASFSHSVSSTVVNSRISCCQAADLEELSAVWNIFSHAETTLEGAGVGSRVSTSVHPSDPLQSFSWPLSDPVKVVACHAISWYNTGHPHCLSRTFHCWLRLIQSDLTPDSWKQRHCGEY